MRLTSIAAGLLILALAGVPALSAALPRAFGAQDQSQQQSQQDQVPQTSQTLKSGVALVNVFATVRDKRHAIVSGLTQDDFKVYEDGVEQKVAFFSKEMNLPITLAILIDTSGSQQSVLGAEQDTASRFVHEIMRKRDEAIVISFDTDVNLLADFTEDPSVLERAIRRTQINAVGAGGVVTPGTVPQGNNAGGTNFYDAVYLACHDELSTEAGRKAVIVLTDAEDTGSQLSLPEAIESAERADTVVHVLLLADVMGYFSQGMGYNGGAVANKMAGDTGGRVIAVRSEKSLEKAFDELAEELRSQYVLSYYPSNEKKDGTFRKIKVETTKDDLKALARRGYYAPSH
jgi:VWFA-related protein